MSEPFVRVGDSVIRISYIERIVMFETGAIGIDFSSSIHEEFGIYIRKPSVGTTQQYEDALRLYYYIAGLAMELPQVDKSRLPVFKPAEEN